MKRTQTAAAAPQPKRRGYVRSRKENDAIEVAGVELTHPDKVLYPEQGITKRALAGYYVAVAERLLPHVVGRPLALVRCPSGHHKSCFFQKNVHGELPPGVDAVDTGQADGALQITVADATGLVALVQMGVLELHPWGARTDALDKPDRLVLDLDPAPGVDFEHVAVGALLLRQRLRELGLEAWLKTTGGKGLHVVVPLQRRQGWDVVKAFAEALALDLVDRDPERYIARASKAERKGKTFVDWLRNARGATAVAPYSTRARPGAPVAMPIAWEELDEGVLPDTFTVENVVQHLKAQKVDPWEDLAHAKQRLTRDALAAVGVEG